MPAASLKLTSAGVLKERVLATFPWLSRASFMRNTRPPPRNVRTGRRHLVHSRGIISLLLLKSLNDVTLLGTD